jgi:PhnB protein
VTIPKDDEDKIMHIAIPIGDGNILMASDVPLAERLVQGIGVYVSVHPASRGDSGNTQRSFRGAEIELPFRRQVWAITTEF